MKTSRVVELLKVERECIKRNSDKKCDRDCGNCDLVQEDYELIEMYDFLLSMMEILEGRKENLTNREFCDYGSY